MKYLWPEISSLDGLSDHQRERLAISFSRSVGILGGNPGAGKTFTLGKIVKALLRDYSAADIGLCAPTGKAGVRMTEGLIANGIEGIEATTSHRMLGVSRNGHDGDGWGFMHNAENPLPYLFILGDEASMYDCSLAGSVAVACRPDTHILWSGDFGQLPPVGHGAPLRDFIASGVVPYGELEEIRRNVGDVIIACRDLKAGRMFKPTAGPIDIEAGRNLKHIELRRGENPLERVTAMLPVLQERFGFDPVWDVQVICALNEGTVVCRDSLNGALQAILNPHGTTPEGCKKTFRLNDKVICGRNQIVKKIRCPNLQFCDGVDSDVVWARSEGKYYCNSCCLLFNPSTMLEDFVANGEIGRVVEMVPGFMHVAFDAPRRTLRFAGEQQDELDLGYAITCHKSQGSQWPCIIVMVDDTRNADFVTSWEWWRTAISRMEKLCFTVGSLSAIARQAKRSALKERKTFLAEKLRSMVA